MFKIRIVETNGILKKDDVKEVSGYVAVNLINKGIAEIYKESTKRKAKK